MVYLHLWKGMSKDQWSCSPCKRSVDDVNTRMTQHVLNKTQQQQLQLVQHHHQQQQQQNHNTTTTTNNNNNNNKMVEKNDHYK